MKTFILFLIGFISLFAPNNARCASKDIKNVFSDCNIRKQLLDNNWEFRMLLNDKNDSVSELWHSVDLPHDWSIESDFSPQFSAGNDGGYLPCGKGIYRKHLNIKNPHKCDTHLYLEGVYMNSEIRINGDSIGNRPYGYSSVIYDITSSLKEGDNIIEITVDNTAQKNCRWYSGSGIYRHVWLIHIPSIGIEPWGLNISTPKVTEKSTDVLLDAKIHNKDLADKDVTITSSIIGNDGTIIATKDTMATITTGKITDIEISIPNLPLKLWSPDSPNLYKIYLDITSEGKIYDRVSETFGARHIEFSADKGFLLNGKSVLINGGCVHHDNGMLGAKSYDAAEARKVSLMKNAGFNAVRTSHNPPSPAFLDECDRQGLLVIDEAFDGWRDQKMPYDYSRHIDKWWEKDLESMVLRDRNHPSIICWSIGNEVIERKKLEVLTTAKRFADKCHELDPSRPVTSALASWDNDWEIYDPLAAIHEIVGYNYMIHKSESDHQRVPLRVMWQTESYPREAFSNWERVNDKSYIIGDFVWTAIDYLGESGIGRHFYTGQTEGEHYQRDQWPWHGAYCGDIDITGLRKPISYYRELLYGGNRDLYMSVREPQGYNGEIRETMWGNYPSYESWTWRGHEEKIIDVEVCSHHSRVRLYLNDKIVGESEISRQNEFKKIFPVIYQPGTLKAVGIAPDGSELLDSVIIKTAGQPYAIRLNIDRETIKADNQDLAYLSAEVVDRDGNLVTDADAILGFSATGACDLIATASADLTDPKGYCSNERKIWKGRAAAVVKSNGKKGNVVIKVSSPGLKPASVKIKTL